MTKKKTPYEYYNECKEKSLDLPIEDYVTATTKINHICSKCNKVYKQTPHNHLNGRGCPFCNGSYKVTNEEYINRCKSKNLDLPIESYKGRKNKLKFRCQYCNEVYTQRADVHVDQEQGHRKCSFSNRKKDYNRYVNECFQKKLDSPTSPKEYTVNNKRALEHICSNGHTYIQRMDLHLQGHGCPKCNRSLGERHIQIYLNKHHIPYEEQKKFPDCVYHYELPFDFYLPKQKILIEYQGIQHYKFNKYFHKTKEDFEKRKIRDKIKKDYAINHGYTLLELTYKLDTQEKINDYLDLNI